MNADDPIATPVSLRIESMVKGSYALLLRLSGDRRLQIGRLGAFDFPEGRYLYFGSALGGLERRVRRHLGRAKKRHWHIDYLTAIAPVTGVWWAAGVERSECAWARAVLELPGVTAPAPGFGSSDCSCTSHLARLPESPGALEAARARIAASQPGVGLQVTRLEAWVAGRPSSLSRLRKTLSTIP